MTLEEYMNNTKPDRFHVWIVSRMAREDVSMFPDFMKRYSQWKVAKVDIEPVVTDSGNVYFVYQIYIVDDL